LIQATLHQLKVFETTARHGSFTKAAQELLITQPTVSTQIRQLTKAVGLPLFEQIGKRLYLTEAGNELYATCQGIFEKLDNFEMKIANFKGTKAGKLKLSVVTTAKYFIPRMLGTFSSDHQGIDISLQVNNHEQLQKRMLENLDDLYILSHLPSEIELNNYPFLENPLVVIAHKDHPLVASKNIPISALNNESFIMRESGSGTRMAVQDLFVQHDVNVHVRLELGSNEAIKQAVAGGLGLSVLSKHTLTPSCEDVAILDIEHFPIQCRWYVAHLAGKELSVLAQSFLDYLLQQNPPLVFPLTLVN
jgi:LysR family transcriptional regulator, low CO2-responsive transcriptional regulator